MYQIVVRWTEYAPRVLRTSPHLFSEMQGTQIARKRRWKVFVLAVGGTHIRNGRTYLCDSAVEIALHAYQESHGIFHQIVRLSVNDIPIMRHITLIVSPADIKKDGHLSTLFLMTSCVHHRPQRSFRSPCIIAKSTCRQQGYLFASCVSILLTIIPLFCLFSYNLGKVSGVLARFNVVSSLQYGIISD